MRASIAIRLFLMVSLSMATVVVAGIGLVRWRLADSGPASPVRAADEAHRIDALGNAFAALYRTHGGWSFLPADAGERSRWLIEHAATLAPADEAPDRRDGAWQTLGFRLALFDAQGRRLAGEEPSRALITLASIDRVRHTIRVDGHAVGYLTVAVPSDARDALAIAFLIQQQQHLALLALVAACLGAFAAAVVAAGFRRPIKTLVLSTRRLGAGHYDTRVDVDRGDELGELASTFNQLAARLAQVEHARRQWVADTSHELRTPLAVLRAQIEALQDGVRPPTGENLALLSAQAGSLARLVDDLHALATADLGARGYDKQRLDPRELVMHVWRGFEERLANCKLAATLTGFDTPIFVLADAERLRQLIANLLENACRYTVPGGQVRLTGEAGGDALRIVIDDSAPGVPAPLIERLGERFFRVDPSRSRAAGGAGLGLALCRGIAEAHGGSLAFSASPLGGLRVVLTLPGAP